MLKELKQNRNNRKNTLNNAALLMASCTQNAVYTKVRKLLLNKI